MDQSTHLEGSAGNPYSTSMSVVSLRLGEAEPETILAYVVPEPSCMWRLAGELGVGLLGITVTELFRRLSCCTAVGFGVSTGLDLVLCLVPLTFVSDWGAAAVFVEGKRGIVFRASLSFAVCAALYSAYEFTAGGGLCAFDLLSGISDMYCVVLPAERRWGLTVVGFHWEPGGGPPRP